jgi:hypothetical protein
MPAKQKRKASGSTTTPDAAAGKSKTIQVHVREGETQDRAVAGMLGRGLVPNAATTVTFLGSQYGELSLMDMARELREQGEVVNRGDMSASERMLTAQSVTLNAMFAELARRAALNMGQHLGATETYLRLALKAQAQSRATVETLHLMKNPRPVAYVQQANIANGPQQINNAPQDNGAAATPGRGENAVRPNELSGAGDGLLANTRTPRPPERAHQGLEAVGVVNRPEND